VEYLLKDNSIGSALLWRRRKCCHHMKLDFSGTNKTKVHGLKIRVADVWV